MDPEVVLSIIVILAGLFSVTLVIFSSATIGRKLADRDVLDIRGINGVRRIEITIKIRTQANRLLLGLVFGLIAILILVDAPPEWRAWSSRLGIMIMLASFTFASIQDWRDDREQLRLVMKEELEAPVPEAVGHEGKQ
jgi:hypothetical protein